MASEIPTTTSVYFNEETCQLTFRDNKISSPTFKAPKLSATPVKSSLARKLYGDDSCCDIREGMSNEEPIEPSVSERGTQTDHNSVWNIQEMDVADQILIQEIYEILPSVLHHLRDIHREEDWINLMKLIAVGKFPMCCCRWLFNLNLF